MLQLIKNEKALNILWFQLGWWSIVLSASKQKELLGFAVALTLLTIHFGFLTKHRLKDVFTLTCCGGLGLFGDFLLIQYEVLTPSNSLSFFPLWLIGLWLIFPITLNYSMAWSLKQKWIKPLVALGAAGSYLAGQSFEILNFKTPILKSFFIITIVWWIYLILFQKSLEKISSRLTA